MKEIKLYISDMDYEKFKLEALCERKDIPSVIRTRLFYKSFDSDIESAFEELMKQEIERI